MTDNVHHPEHYNKHPAGIEAIDVIEPFTFNVGSAVKYLWRAGLKGDAIEDLMKAHWFVVREIGRLKRGEVQDELRRRLHEHLEFIQAAAQAQVGEPPAEAAAEAQVGEPPAEAAAEAEQAVTDERKGKRNRW